MCFKKWLKIFFYFTFSVLIISCQMDTDDAESNDTLEIKGGNSLSCVDDKLSPFIKEGLQNTTDGSVEAAFDCLGYVVEVVDKHINVESQDDISLPNVKSLLRKKIDNYDSETEKFIKIFFEIKQKIVKGHKKRISHKELKDLRVFILRLKKVYLKLYPLANLMLEQYDEKSLSDDVIVEKLSAAKKLVVALFFDYKLSFSKEELERWLSSANILLTQTNLDKWNLYWSFHKLMWSAQGERLTTGNVSLWAKSITDYLRFMLNTKHNWTLESYFNGIHTEQVLEQANSLLSSVEESIHLNKNNIFSYKDINSVLYYYERLNKLPRSLTLKTLQRMIPIVFEKMISVPKNLRDKNSYFNKVYGKSFKPYYKGIHENHFRRIREEFDLYKKTQLKIVRGHIYPGLSPEPTGVMGEMSFVDIVRSIPTYFSLDRQGLVIERQAGSEKYNKKNLSLLNVFRSLTRAVAVGYNTPTRRKNIYEGIYRPELEVFVREFSDLFNQLYIMAVGKSTVENIVGRMYIESKVFVASGDGYRLEGSMGKLKKYSMIRMNEAIEVISHYASTLSVFPSSYDQLKSKCSETVTNHDVFGLPAIPKKCFNDHFLSIVIDKFDNLPGLQAYLARHDEERKLIDPGEVMSFEESLVYSIKRIDEVDDTFLTYAEYSKIGTLLIFVESLFLKFDTDNNHFIDKGEVDVSYDYFKDLIADSSKYASYCTEVSYRKLLTLKGDELLKNSGACAYDYSAKTLAEVGKGVAKGLKSTWGFFTGKNENKLSYNQNKNQMPINADGEVSVDRYDVLKVLGFLKK